MLLTVGVLCSVTAGCCIVKMCVDICCISYDMVYILMKHPGDLQGTSYNFV